MSLADTPDAPTKATEPFLKRNRRVLIGLLVSAVVIVGLMAVMLSYHPRWHMVTGVGKPGTWVSSVECPQDWQPSAQDARMRNMGFTGLTVRRRPLTGVWAWLNRLMPHPSNNKPAELHVYVMPRTRSASRGQPLPPVGSHADHVRDAEATIHSFEMAYKQGGWRMRGYKIFCERVSHPLGPAIAVSMENLMAAPVNTGAGNNALTNVSRHDSLYIAPTEAGDFTGMISVSYSGAPEEAAALKPIMERMMRSIRVVKK